MADKTYKIQATLSNGGTIETGTFVVPQGPAGESAGFGTPTVSTTTGNPGTNASVTITANTSSPNTAKVFDFEFTIPRGADGQEGSVASLTSANTTTAQPLVSGVSLDTTTKVLTVTEFNGTVGSIIKPIFLDDGVPTALSRTIGSPIKHIYLSEGAFVASPSTIGSGTKPMYMYRGNFRASSSTVGSGTRLMYMSSGTFTNSSSNVGNASTPIYMSDGVFTECTSINVDDGTL